MKNFLPYLANKDLGDLIDLLRYFSAVLQDGDYLNDWLTHLPPTLADATLVIGTWLSSLLN